MLFTEALSLGYKHGTTWHPVYKDIVLVVYAMNVKRRHAIPTRGVVPRETWADTPSDTAQGLVALFFFCLMTRPRPPARVLGFLV